LHKGLLDVIFLPELLDNFETCLPIFERSLIDPESPALNEDGEFPEFDLNVIYNTENVKTLKTQKYTNKINTNHELFLKNLSKDKSNKYTKNLVNLENTILANKKIKPRRLKKKKRLHRKSSRLFLKKLTKKNKKIPNSNYNNKFKYFSNY
jgi:hypothetical protein